MRQRGRRVASLAVLAAVAFAVVVATCWEELYVQLLLIQLRSDQSSLTVFWQFPEGTMRKIAAVRFTEEREAVPASVEAFVACFRRSYIRSSSGEDREEISLESIVNLFMNKRNKCFWLGYDLEGESFIPVGDQDRIIMTIPDDCEVAALCRSLLRGEGVVVRIASHPSLRFVVASPEEHSRWFMDRTEVSIKIVMND